MIRLFFILFLACCGLWLSADCSAQTYTISGTVKDASTGETLLGANVYDVDNTAQGTQSNTYGFYSLSVGSGAKKIACTYVGYQNYTKDMTINENVKMDIALVPVGVQGELITIEADRKNTNVTGTEMGTVELEMDKIKTLPAFMGEVDILKTMVLLPGIKNGGDGSTGFFVRGGAADQNLILLDDAVVYNTGHMLGFFSVFNADAIKNMTVIKGNMPSQYGGRLSSVLDVNMKEGNNKKFQVEGGIGAIASRLTVQGPIQRDKSSFIISARRTYVFDVVKPAIEKTKFKGTNYYFYDLNTKANFRISDKDRIYFSGYFGRDVLKFNSNDRGFSIQVPYGNTTATLRWNRIVSNKWFMNTTAVYNNYKFAFTGKQDAFMFKLSSGIEDYNLKMDLDCAANEKHYLKMGASYTFHTFTPNTATIAFGDDIDLQSKEQKRFAHEVAFYINDDYKISSRITANIGIRIPFYQQVGPYDNIKYNASQVEISRTAFAKGKPVVTYKDIEPRLSVNYRLSALSSLKMGYSRNNQFIHLVSSSASTLPTDLWVPSTLKVKPQQGQQVALGYFRNSKDNMFEGSIETYYKKMRNQIEYKDGNVPQLDYDTDETFTFGKGEAFGVEFLVKKNLGKLTGWVGYTLSKTQRFFPELNGGRVFQASYDRRHDISIVGMYQLSKRWEFGTAFIYYTGRAFTLATGGYIVNNWLASQYTERNGYRLIPYHRIDVSATWKAKETKKLKQSVTIALFNAYNRKNQDFITSSNELTANGFVNKAFQISIFPIIPSITYNFKF